MIHGELIDGKQYFCCKDAIIVTNDEAITLEEFLNLNDANIQSDMVQVILNSWDMFDGRPLCFVTSVIDGYEFTCDASCLVDLVVVV